ncbi:protein IRREGULAR XYLEM 15-like [Ananas comosus]|uniref:Protein IRREGULAR XYLEM 15 n=1 Tax=Ananas comosus TaxID=4615 RepID=A0A199W6X9_ANACO|nr:protein IRREGULAR XYLEM 15-like [Ananas comosus]OAY84953.1 Protein IRREGULAR XYLEM 15 [Ananas comosus]
MKGPNNAKLIVLHPSLHKGCGGGGGGGGGSFLVSIHRLWVIAFVSFSALASLLLTLLSRHPAHRLPPHPAMPMPMPGGSSSCQPALSPVVFDALLHYAASASASANSSGGRMAEADLRAAAGVVWRRAPCNLLVFGLGAETPLWRALNAGGRTVFLDENEYYVAHMESLLPGLEAYDVAFASYARARDLGRLLSVARAARAAECRPVQDLLFSDCPLALNDLPNHLYDVAWDVILVDGPRGNDPAAPGRMAPIFSAAVMARSRKGKDADVLVHDYDREVERACSQEFLCEQNRAAATSTPTLAHFVIRAAAATAAAGTGAFCTNSTAPSF